MTVNSQQISIYPMDYDVDYRDEHAISVRALILLFSAGAVAGFIVLATFVFPLSNLIRDEVSEQATVLIKQDTTCVVEASDQRPRTIENCSFDAGDSLLISYKEGTLPILSASRAG